MNLGFQSPLYRYAYTAQIGRVAQPVRETWIGEVEAHNPADALQKINTTLRALCGFYPRAVRCSRGQFARMKGTQAVIAEG